MAIGPEAADAVQRYMQKMAAMDFGEESEGPENTEEGEIKSFIGEVFKDGDLREFEDENWKPGSPISRAMDQFFGAVETTQHGKRKIEGLRALQENKEKAYENQDFSKKTWYNWRDDYVDAGLITSNGAAITPEGEVFLDTENKVEQLDMGEVYHLLTTKGYGDSEPNNGRKFDAFFLYCRGAGHQTIADRLEGSESTLRNMANQLQEKDVLSEDYTATERGEEIVEIIFYQMEELQEITREHLEKKFDGGNEYFRKALSRQ